MSRGQVLDAALVAVLVSTCVAVGWRLGRGVDLIELWGQIRREIFRSPHPRHVLHLRLDGAFFSTVVSTPGEGTRVRITFNTEEILCSSLGSVDFAVRSSQPDAAVEVARYVNTVIDGESNEFDDQS